MKFIHTISLLTSTLAMLAPNFWTHRNKFKLERIQSNKLVDYDEPVFSGLKPQQFFYEEKNQEWVAGIVLSPRKLFPFTSSLETEIIGRSKGLLKMGYEKTAFELMSQSFERDSNVNQDIIAFYAMKKDKVVQLGSVGYWWAAIFRNGEVLHITEPLTQEQGDRKKSVLAEFWDIEENDMLIVTRGEFGHKHDGQIRKAVKQAEDCHMTLKELVIKIQDELKSLNSGHRKIFIVLRMVKSREQTSEL